MNCWSLVREVGIEYVEPSGVGDSDLCFPVSAERAPDGTTLIVDENLLGKNLTVLTDCRTLRVDPSGATLYDSLEHGIHDAYGCLLDEGRMAVLRRTAWDLIIMTADGEQLRRIDLSKVSSRAPKNVTRTPRGTLVVAFADEVYAVDIAEVDSDGNLLWTMPNSRQSGVGCPTSVHPLAHGGVLVTDEFCHTAMEFARDGSLIWQYGERRNPASGQNRLSNPMGARQLSDGSRLVADTRNHRIISIAPDDDDRHVELSIADLNSPTSVERIGNENLLVCDAGNRRVVELDADLNVVWQYGRQLARRRPFSFPRSVEVTSSGAYVLADTAYNRVVSVSGENLEVLADSCGAGLFWPRCARVLPDGSILIADGRNSRIVEVGGDGSVARELRVVKRAEGELWLKDPHDVMLLPNRHVLVADASLDMVLEVDWDGNVHWAAGDRDGHELKDPHSAQELVGGEVLITDTNAHRLVWVDRAGAIVRELHAFRAGDHLYRLNRPKHAAVSAAGTLMVVDSFNNRVLAGTPDGELRWELSEIPDSPLPEMSQPRWATLIGPDEVVVSDHSNHRVVHLVRRP